jgi:ADP-ribosylglycohydrolase
MPLPPRPKKKPTHAAPEQVQARCRGALLGLAVGDALGVTNTQRNVMAPSFPELADGPQTELLGRGPASLKAGQVSWAAELALCLSTALRNHRGFDVVEVAKTYARWLPDGLEVPESIVKPLELVREGRSGEFSGRQAWLDGAQRVNDGAALARTVPLAVYFHADPAELVRASLEETGITHFAPLCQVASATFNGLVAAALDAPGETLDHADAVKVLDAQLSLAAASLGRTHPELVTHAQDAAAELRSDLVAARDDDPMLYGPDLHLFHRQTVRVALRLALWELFHAPTFEAGVLDAINRGGEAGINGAVTGALLGAVFGEHTIPERWVEGVMAAPGFAGGPHFSVYHPRFLVTLEPHS